MKRFATTSRRCPARCRAFGHRPGASACWRPSEPRKSPCRLAALHQRVGGVLHRHGTGRSHVPGHRSVAGSGGHVTFQPGARSAWHTHPVGQTLVITSGLGWVQQWGGPKQEVRAGDVVRFPPGVKHWHGASAPTAMTHIAIREAVDGRNVNWLEQLSDEQYRGGWKAPFAGSIPLSPDRVCCPGPVHIARVSCQKDGMSQTSTVELLGVSERGRLAGVQRGCSPPWLLRAPPLSRRPGRSRARAH